MTNPELISRLIVIDAALASRVGLHLGEAAEKFGVSTKTVRRDLQTLSNIKAVVCEQVAAHNHAGHSHRHWYADRRRRVFTRWLAQETAR